MRVRYGKPIKVKSLLGQSNIPFSYTGPNVTFYPLTTGTFNNYAGPGVQNIKYVNRQANHKYFIYLNANATYTWTYFGIWDTYNSGYDGNRTAPIKDGNNYYTIISPTTSISNGVPTLQFGNTNSSIANYALIIDLTEIGLDNLTAQQFYNKYNKYFPLIATGEEITIDDKAGQISLGKTLPLNYTEVEYLESTGTQYIELPFGFDATDEIEYKMSINSGYSYDKYLISPKTWNTNNNRFAMGIHNGVFACGFGSISTGNTLVGTTGYDSDIHIWKYKNKLFTIEDLNLSKDVSSITFGSTTSNLKLFYGYNSNTGGKFCYYKHYKNNEIIINLIPCYRNSDNKPGLYDKVTGTFYTNAGTGEFVLGPVVESSNSNILKCKITENTFYDLVEFIYISYNGNAPEPPIDDYADVLFKYM